jgi:ABC-type sugar transport system substrate-binding protein
MTRRTTFAMAAATVTSLAAAAAAQESPTVCYVTAADSHAYVTPANEALNARAAELGIEILSLSQEFNAQTGTDQLNTCIARGVDGIILWPLDPQAYIPGLARAQQAGIPVLLINSPMDSEAEPLYASFTGPDVYMQGEMAADAMNEVLGGEGNVVIIAGQAGNGTTIGRVNGFNEQLAEIGSQIQVLDTVNADFDQQKSLVASRDLITRFGDEIDGVYANDDMMARGFLDAWKEVHPDQPPPPVVGIGGMQNAFEALEAGEMAATIIQSPAVDGRLAIDTMVSILNGETVEKRIPMELTVVTPENVGEHEPAY